MSDNETLPVPEVVDFVSEGIPCKAIVVCGERSLNMRSCLVNLGKSVEVSVNHLSGRTRVTINHGQVWFDTSEESAVRVEALLTTGKAPLSH